MSDEIIKILDDLGERFGLAIDWTSANVIPQLEVLYDKFVNYSLITNGIWLAFGGVLMTIAIIMLVKLLTDYAKCFKTKSDTQYFEYTSYTYLSDRIDPNVLGFIILCVTIFGLIAGIPMFAVNLSDTIKLLTIPELYVFEYLNQYL